MRGEPRRTTAVDEVILVDERDRELGVREKLAAHRTPALHRAFSVFLFSDEGAMLIQQRAAAKYHSARLWSNACCGHPRPGEETKKAARRRLREELGLTCSLTAAARFVYRAELGNGLVEFEYDHVFVGLVNADPVPDPREVEAWRWVHAPTLDHEMSAVPAAFTAWFSPALAHLRRWLTDAPGEAWTSARSRWAIERPQSAREGR